MSITSRLAGKAESIRGEIVCACVQRTMPGSTRATCASRATPRESCCSTTPRARRSRRSPRPTVGRPPGPPPRPTVGRPPGPTPRPTVGRPPGLSRREVGGPPRWAQAKRPPRCSRSWADEAGGPSTRSSRPADSAWAWCRAPSWAWSSTAAWHATGSAATSPVPHPTQVRYRRAALGSARHPLCPARIGATGGREPLERRGIPPGEPRDGLLDLRPLFLAHRRSHVGVELLRARRMPWLPWRWHQRTTRARPTWSALAETKCE